MSAAPRNILHAVCLLNTHTSGRFDCWYLAGPRSASIRAQIATALAGKRVPQSKSGVTALRASFYALAQLAGDHEAAREAAFAAWCRNLLDSEAAS